MRGFMLFYIANMSHLVQNKKVYYNYEVLETKEVGLILKGYEVKAIRASRMSLDGSYVKVNVLNRKLFLTGGHITALQQNNLDKDADFKRPIELLVSKKDFSMYAEKLNQKGLSLVVTSIYSNNGLLKAELALVRGKKKYDKRETIKKRDAEREMRRAM